MSNQTKYLNLDELETAESDITIKHKGVDHKMAVLEVDAFIVQQKRARETERLAQEAGSVNEGDVVAVVELIRDAIQEFFPTLPVGELPTAKLFTIFAWLNELTAQLNDTASPEDGEGVTVSAEGNVEAAVS